ncbi:hypothetical protein RFI_38675 [Reticulomyxa filosa]|uniref:Uncharacterized protein n=1 Tax=Reticulomyxa filosa TaxID=46433 RepID=X6L9V2_RETFI|nr:hypothetical protein RFI_38675 [Reticulomyxa filosa]|eukprot:ETN98812.1 hypothetical protein RFI_38675 [Reticulomyxa filosa]
MLNKKNLYEWEKLKQKENHESTKDCLASLIALAKSDKDWPWCWSLQMDKQVAPFLMNVMSLVITLRKIMSMEVCMRLLGNILYHWLYNRRCEDLTHEMFDFFCLSFFIFNYYALDTEIDKDISWNEANKKVHEMVNEMINNKQQGIVIVAKNIDELSKLNYQFLNMMFLSK